MFAILIPASLSPLIITLYWAERKAKRLGLVHSSHDSSAPITTQIWNFAQNLDIIGLAILGTSVALILLPMTLAQRAKDSWSNREQNYLCLALPGKGRLLTSLNYGRLGTASMIAMFVLGWILLPVFALWDIKFAKRPVIARRFLSNRTVVCVAFIGFFDFVRVVP